MTHNTAANGGVPRAQDDLFRHVNGEWLETAQIPDDQPIYGAFLELRDDSELACRTIVEELADVPAEPGSPEQLIRDLYASFMDTARVQELGTAPFQAQLRRVDSVTGVEDLLALLGTLRREGVGGLFGLAVDTDPDQPDQYLPYLYQGGLTLPDESYYQAEQFAPIREAYQPHLVRMLGLLDVADPQAVAASVYGLETEIAAVHWDRVRSRDRSQTHNPTDRAGLEKLLPATLWRLWEQGATAGESPLLDHVEVMQPSYFSGVAELLVAERLVDWKNWLRWKIIRSLAAYGPDAIVQENFDFFGRTLSGTPALKERWKRGVGLVEGGIGEALGKLYVERHFPPAAKERMDELVANLLKAYRRNISTLHWMTDETKERALEKLSTFTPKVGYPKTFRDYAGLVIDPADLVGNVRRIGVAELDRELAKVGQPVDRDEWFMTPQTVNAYYNPGMNEIVFPAAILRAPFFDPEAGDATNYGGIGAVIGHEIGHGFDDQGSKYDGSGALRDWWTQDDRRAFEALTGKLIDQYASLSPEGSDGEHVNGALTIGENIGDLGGLGIAYQALLFAGSEDERQAPSLDREAAQAFFVNWARVWRAKTRPAEVRRRLATDPHSPPEFRCNQVVRNLTEFYEAFDLTPEDELWLDEADRVRIW